MAEPPEDGNATCSTHVLAKIRAPKCTLCVGQTMVSVLHVLSEVAPEWVRAYVPAEWVERYGERLSHERLPKEEEERKQYANQVGKDGWAKLPALDAPSTADWLKTLPAVMTLRTSLRPTVRAARARGAMANGTGSPSCSTHQLPL
jgi:hypothetical protein